MIFSFQLESFHGRWRNGYKWDFLFFLLFVSKHEGWRPQACPSGGPEASKLNTFKAFHLSSTWLILSKQFFCFFSFPGLSIQSHTDESQTAEHIYSLLFLDLYIRRVHFFNGFFRRSIPDVCDCFVKMFGNYFPTSSLRPSVCAAVTSPQEVPVCWNKVKKNPAAQSTNQMSVKYLLPF